MSKTKIKFDYEGKAYTLEFTAASLKKMEKVEKFDFTTIESRMLTAAEDLFCGMFIEHHGDVPHRERVKIFNALSANCDGQEILEVITQALQEAFDELQTHIVPSGNVKWRVEN